MAGSAWVKEVILFIPPFFGVCVREHIGLVCVYVAYEHPGWVYLFMCMLTVYVHARRPEEAI